MEKPCAYHKIIARSGKSEDCGRVVDESLQLGLCSRQCKYALVTIPRMYKLPAALFCEKPVKGMAIKPKSSNVIAGFILKYKI
jgi:hypothetical protein